MRSQLDTASRTVLDGVQDGLSLAEAASRAGVPVDTVAGWAAKGRKDPEGRFGAFAAELDEARRNATASLSGELMSLDELRLVVAAKARAGSVQAMKLAYELLRDVSDAPAKPSGLAALDELAAKRKRQRGGAA